MLEKRTTCCCEWLHTTQEKSAPTTTTKTSKTSKTKTKNKKHREQHHQQKRRGTKTAQQDVERKTPNGRTTTRLDAFNNSQRQTNIVDHVEKRSQVPVERQTTCCVWNTRKECRPTYTVSWVTAMLWSVLKATVRPFTTKEEEEEEEEVEEEEDNNNAEEKRKDVFR